MADYISREAAIDAIWKPEVRPNALIFDALRRACEEEVKHIPSADVVEVVRCKNCVSARPATGDTVLLCDAWSDEYSVAVREDGYCHLGEKTRKVVEIDQVKEAEE